MRYIDNINVKLPHGTEYLNKFVEHLNSRSQHIQFTKEFEDNNFILFLEVLISKKEDGSLSHQVYHKKTYTKQYLHANSHHHPSKILRNLNTLATRALRIFVDEQLDQENHHLMNNFLNRGYKSG